MARRSNNRTRGGKQRSEDKQWEYFECACCKKDKVSKRKTIFLGHDKDGKPIRVCKSHKLKSNSPGVKKNLAKMSF
jgi:hypothetical protein